MSDLGAMYTVQYHVHWIMQQNIHEKLRYCIVPGTHSAVRSSRVCSTSRIGILCNVQCTLKGMRRWRGIVSGCSRDDAVCCWNGAPTGHVVFPHWLIGTVLFDDEVHNPSP